MRTAEVKPDIGIRGDHPALYAIEIAERHWQVPAFRVDSFTKKASRYCLVVPVINEGERIQTQLRTTFELGISDRVDVIVVDGGSTDGSLDSDFLQSCNVRMLITKTGSGQLSAQLRCAYAVALIEGYAGIVTIDGNGKDSVVNVDDFVAALEAGVDYAQASRFISGGGHQNSPLLRLFAIRMIHAPVLSLAAGRFYSDTTQGFRAYSARYLLDRRVAPFRDVFGRYELLAYLTVRASQLGYLTSQVATTRAYPKHEKVPTKISGWASYADLIGVLISVCSGQYNPSSSTMEDDRA